MKDGSARQTLRNGESIHFLGVCSTANLPSLRRKRLHPVQLIGVVAILLSAAGMNLDWSLKWSKAPAVE